MSLIIDRDYQKYLAEAEDKATKLKVLRKEVIKNCKDKFPDLNYKSYVGLCNGIKANNLDKRIVNFVKKDIAYINSQKEEIKTLKEKAVEILDKLSIEYRKRVKKLDPIIDIIPKDTYPKLSDCSVYPKRQSCNYGSTKTTDWDRCEYMKYNNNKSIFDNDRWECTHNKTVN